MNEIQCIAIKLPFMVCLLGNHARQHSMEPWEDPAVLAEERKILADRGKSGSQQRHMAHSLVGTPNYIAPEVLEGSGELEMWRSVVESCACGSCASVANIYTKGMNYTKKIHSCFAK